MRKPSGFLMKIEYKFMDFMPHHKQFDKRTNPPITK